MNARVLRLLLGVAAAALVVFVAMPVLAISIGTPLHAVIAALKHPAMAAAAKISLLSSSLAIAIIVVGGTPLAWWLSRRTHPLSRSIETLMQLPTVLPPAVAGLALLITFGRRGVLAPLMAMTGSPAFGFGAVVMAQVFVAAPLFINAATSAFRRIDEDTLLVARSLGASDVEVLLRLAVPLSAQALLAGATLALARALGEFGATLMFAGNLEAHTQTLPLLVYVAFDADALLARGVAAVLVAVAVVVLLVARGLMRRSEP